MKHFRFSMISDLLFYGTCAFVFSLCILRYFKVPLWLSLIVAGMLALAAAGLLFVPMYLKSRKKLLGKAEKERRDALLLHLALEKPERVQDALLDAYLADGKEARKEAEGLLVEGVPLFPLFTMEPVGADTIASLLRRYGTEPFAIACNALTADAEKLMNSFGLRAERGDDVFALFERTGTTPEKLICGEIPRKTAKQKLRRSFQKSNARPYFTSGILLLLMSLFTFFPVYYIISGSVLLFCSVVVRLFGYAE